MTKKEFLEKVIASVEEGSELAIYATNELDNMKKQADSRKQKAHEKTLATYDGLVTKLVDFMTSNADTVFGMQTIADVLECSIQKASRVCKCASEKGLVKRLVTDDKKTAYELIK